MLRWQVATYYSIIILVHMDFRQKVGCKSLDCHIHNKYYIAIESRCVGLGMYRLVEHSSKLLIFHFHHRKV
jgi:hypothetical protein